MTLEQKLQFLTDRAKDGLTFYSTYDQLSFIDGELRFLDGLTWKKDYLEINELKNCKFSLTKEWDFTPEEKVILKSINKTYKWIARDEDNSLYLYYRKPFKTGNCWSSTSDTDDITLFKHLFNAIQWNDKEPCEFKNYL